MNWIAVVVFAGMVGVDATSFGQFMISRPFIAATITGALTGVPVAGAIIGLVLELFALVTLPVGASRYPESGTAAVAATSAYALVTNVVDPAALLIAISFALAWEHVAGGTVIILRQFNDVVLRRALASTHPLDRALERSHVACIAIDFARGALVSALGAALCAALLYVLVPRWQLSDNLAWTVLLAGGACMLAATLRMFGDAASRRVAFVVGIACGSLIALLS